MSRIDALIRQMTLAEKLGQLTMSSATHAVTGPVIPGDSTDSIRAGTVGNLLNLIGADHVREVQRLAVEESRLKVPLLIALDVIHGHRTLFPVPLAEAALFDPVAWALTAREAAKEAAADGIAMTFAPMLDVSRDPRWGRMVEGPGEDPVVGASLAAAKVAGFQGSSLGAADSVAAVAKHYFAYGAVTAGRDYASVDVSERTLKEVYLPPFAAAVTAGVAAVMPAFTDLAGIPMSADTALLRGWLRERLGFKGVIVSDYNAIGELLHHGVAADLPEAAALALKAGVDIDMVTGAYRHGLPVALERGLVTMGDIDESVRRVLTLKEQLGLFDDPYRRGLAPGTPGVASSSRTVRASGPAGSGAMPAETANDAEAQRRKLARDVAARAIVMLTNVREVLPLSPSLRRLAVLGPLAEAPAEMRGPWWSAAVPEGQVSVLAGIRSALPDAQILYAPGVAIEGKDCGGVAAAADLCNEAEAILLCLGEGATMSGEAASRAYLDLPGQQRTLAEAVLERAAALRKPTVVILFSGRPLVVPWLIEKADAVLAAWFLGSEAGNAIADVLTGRVSPSGRTPVSWPRAVGQVPVFYAERPTGRPFDPENHYSTKYRDVPNDPQFPFGHGLSYGRFELSNLQVRPELVTERDTIEARVDLINQGPRPAEETLFLFVHRKVASVARPVLELKAFGKISLRPGEQGTLTLRLPAADLRFPGVSLQPVFEPGEVQILVGPCADRSRLLAGRVELVAGRR